MSLTTPIARVRGLGAARTGVTHFKQLRLTSVASAALSLWFIWNAVGLSGADYATVTAWLSSTVNAALMILFVLVNVWHGALGVQTIIEDYVHNALMKTWSLIALALVAYGIATVSTVAVLKVALGG